MNQAAESIECSTRNFDAYRDDAIRLLCADAGSAINVVERLLISAGFAGSTFDSEFTAYAPTMWVTKGVATTRQPHAEQTLHDLFRDLCDLKFKINQMSATHVMDNCGLAVLAVERTIQIEFWPVASLSHL